MIKEGQLEKFAAFHKFPCIPLHDQHIDGAEEQHAMLCATAKPWKF